jgi:hypothetical protein
VCILWKMQEVPALQRVREFSGDVETFDPQRGPYSTMQYMQESPNLSCFVFVVLRQGLSM